MSLFHVGHGCMCSWEFFLWDTGTSVQFGTVNRVCLAMSADQSNCTTGRSEDGWSCMQEYGGRFFPDG